MAAAAHLLPFLFDRDFDNEALSSTRPASAATSEAAPPQLEEALAEARADGYAEGYRSALSEASTAAEHHVAQALDALNDGLAALGADLRGQEAEISRQSVALATIICRKFLPYRYRETAPAEITSLFANFLPRIGEMPTVTVRVADSLVAPLAERLIETARLAAFPGAVQTIGDAATPEGDCRIEWSRGGIVRDAAILWREVDALIEETIGALPFDPPAPASSLSNPLQRDPRDA